MLVAVGILAFIWPKGAFGGDDFPGQQLVVFGTSMSDNGNGVHPYIAQTLKTDQNWPVSPPYYFSNENGGGTFSNGPTWPDYLGKTLNITVLDYAIGGAAIATYPWSSLANSFTDITPCLNFPILPSAPNDAERVVPLPTLWDQVNQYIVGGVYPSSVYLNSSRQRSVHSTIPHENVYVIEFGGNDLIKGLRSLQKLLSSAGPITPTSLLDLISSGQIQDFTQPLVDGVQQALVRLYQAGARRFVLWHMIPSTLTPSIKNQLGALADTPQGRAGVLATDGLLGSINLRFNELAATFPRTHRGSVVAIFDTGRAYREIMENKAAYGIKNTTDACLSNWDACTPSTTYICSKPDEYFFYDFVHPSTVTHRALAQKLYDLVHPLLIQGQASLNRTSAPQAGRSQSAGGPSGAPAGSGVTSTGGSSGK
eukprot:jgi/Botrbrau1/6444/Bobra.0034s0020.1